MIEHNFLDPYQIHVCHNTGTLPWAQYDGLESVHLNYSSSKLNILTPSLTKTDSEKCKNITSDLRSDPIKTPTMHLHHMFAYLYNTLTFYTSPGTRHLHLIIQLSLWLQYCLYIQRCTKFTWITNTSCKQYLSVNLALWTAIGLLDIALYPWQLAVNMQFIINVSACLLKT